MVCFGWWWTCLFLSFHTAWNMEKRKNIVTSLFLSSQTAWWLLSFMLAPCCFWEPFLTVITTCHTHTLKCQSRKKTCIFRGTVEGKFIPSPANFLPQSQFAIPRQWWRHGGWRQYVKPVTPRRAPPGLPCFVPNSMLAFGFDDCGYLRCEY